MPTPLFYGPEVIQDINWTVTLEVLCDGYVRENLPLNTRVWIETQLMPSGRSAGVLRVSCELEKGAEMMPVDKLELLLVLQGYMKESDIQVIRWTAQLTEQAHDEGFFDVANEEGVMGMNTFDDPFTASAHYKRWPRMWHGVTASASALVVQKAIERLLV